MTRTHGMTSTIAVFAAATLAGAAIGVVDLHATEPQGAALLILVASLLCAAAVPRAVWATTTVLGLSIFVAHAVARALGADPEAGASPLVGTLLAIIPAAVGAGAGLVIRKLVEHAAREM